MATQDTSIRQVFISHATQDAEFAHRLAGDLQQLGVPIWIAPESIRPGESWVEAIERGLGESCAMLVVLTPAALESRWVKKETSVAIALEREGCMEVIPLDVQPCDVPLLLKSYQMVSFRQGYDAGFSQLAGILGLRVVEREKEPPAAISPRQPFEPEMVLIPAGEFLMGSDLDEDKDARRDEQPRHTLYLPDYSIAKTPVTNAQYAVFVETAGRKPPEHWKDKRPPPSKEDHPVVWVNWYDAVAYCKWLAEATGQPYRLPSGAEWEKAARGTDGRIYPWGNEWEAERCNTSESGKGGTTPVGSYPQGASPYGLLDMAGNVWEWTRSKYKGYPYTSADGREGLGAEAEVLRVMRGGSWFDQRSYARCAARRRGLPDSLWSSMGFRLCVSFHEK
jgi:formylglycine-generating enzyme required for sulfatase activity